MAMSYAVIGGRVTQPGTDVGIRAKVTVTPNTKDGLLKFPAEDRLTVGAQTAETDSSGNLGTLKVPTNHGIPDLTWHIHIKPLDRTPGLPQEGWPLGDFPITADTRLDDLVPVELVAITPTTLDTVAQYASDAQAAAAAAQAVGTTNDTVMAARIADPASATSTALSASIAAPATAAAAAAPLLQVMRQGLRDAYYLAIGDSRGDGRVASNGSYMDEFHELLADHIHAEFPAYSIVEYRLAVALDGTWDAPVTRYTGTGSRTFYLYNGQAAGTDWSHPLTTADSHWRTLPQGAHPDLIVFAHGRNEGVYTAVERIYQTVEQVRAAHPQAGCILATEMPSLDSTANADYAAQRARATVRAAQVLGCGLVDFWQTFTSDPRGAGALLRPDGVHPTAVGMSDTTDFNGNPYTLPTGSQVAADALWAAMWSPHPVSPRPLPPPSFNVPGTNLLTNPCLTDWNGSALVGWSKSTGATVTKDRDYVETGAQAVKVAQTVDGSGNRAFIAQSIDARPWRGQRMTLAARERIRPADVARSSAGQIELECGVTVVRGRGFLSNSPQGRFFWQVLSLDVPTDVDVLTTRLYADYTAGTTGTAQPTYDRVYLGPGPLPHDVSPLPSPFAGNAAIDPATLGASVLRWHKPSSLSGNAEGASIATWADSSASALALTGGTVKPTYSVGAVNGTPGAVFVKNSAGVLNGAAGSNVAQPYTLYAVAQPSDITNTRVIVGTPNTGIQIRADGSGVFRYAAVIGSAMIYGPRVISGRAVVLAAVIDGTNTELWVNGQKATVVTTGATATPVLSALNVGNNASPSGSVTFDGAIGELVAVSGHNSGDTITGVTEYLRTAAAITA